jgi:hypothetical protein
MSLAPLLACPVCAASGSAPLGLLLPLLLVVPYVVAWLVLRAVRTLADKERQP